jgi:hypothetical protein
MRREIGSGIVGRGAAHLAENDLGYFAHLRVALRIGASLIGAGLACLVHGLVPGAFTTAASRTVRRLHASFEQRPAPSAATGSAVHARPAEAEA